MPHTKEIDLDSKSTKVCPKTCTGGTSPRYTHRVQMQPKVHLAVTFRTFQDFKSEVHWNLEVFVTLEARVVFVRITKAFTNKLSQSQFKGQVLFIKS